MWADLLPKLVGGTMVDDDAPGEPTKIIGYELTETTVYIKGEDFDMGGARQFWGISADANYPGRFFLRGYGFSGVLVPPEGYKS